MYRYFYILLFLTILVFQGCDSQPENENDYNKPLYIGQRFNEDGAIDCNQLKDKLGNATEMEAKVKGEIIGICPDKSCELKMDMEDGTCMVVKMDNIPVSIPKDATGKTAIIEGKAYIDTTTLKSLPQYRADSGESVSESEEATDPEITLAFAAKGVIIK